MRSREEALGYYVATWLVEEEVADQLESIESVALNGRTGNSRKEEARRTKAAAAERGVATAVLRMGDDHRLGEGR